MRFRSPWLLSVAPAVVVAACSVYGTNLVSTGGAGGTITTSGTGGVPVGQGGTGGTTTTRATGGMGGASSSSTSSSTTSGTGSSNTTTSSTSSTTTSSTSSTTTSSTTSSTTTSSTTTSSTSSTTTSSSSSSSTSSSSGVTSGSLLISQIKTRGLDGGSDEWVEIYNPGSSSVTFDSTWALEARNATLGVSGCATVAYGLRFNGGGQVIPAHGHILYANSAGFSESATTPADGTYSSSYGIPDAASVVLLHGAAVADALCFYYDTATESTLACPGSAFTCSGTPVMNPHNNTTSTDSNTSLERQPGGSGGNTANSGNNALDFASTTPADPHDLASTPVP